MKNEQNFQPKINYHILMQEEIKQIMCISNEKHPSLLLHSCCAPCSTVCLERLIPYFDITVFFYNPNIEPQNEFEKRLEAQKRYLQENPMLKNVKLVVPQNQKDDFFKAIDLKNFPERREEREGGARCMECYKFRLEKTALYALENNFDYWTTTITTGPQKDAQKVNEAGNFIQEKLKSAFPKFLHADFKKDGGYLRSIQLCKEYGIYRQKYCGCTINTLVI
ncbi:MAG: epoxyqueuosine reductase QueH [Treponemataceae bacterium]